MNLQRCGKTAIYSNNTMKSNALDARVNLMSAAYDRLRRVTTVLTEKAEELEDLMHTFERLLDRFAADPELEK